jgi:hypothetical protein
VWQFERDNNEAPRAILHSEGNFTGFVLRPGVSMSGMSLRRRVRVIGPCLRRVAIGRTQTRGNRGNYVHRRGDLGQGQGAGDWREDERQGRVH